MATFLHTVRLFVGLAMLAAGAVLTQPLAAAVFSGQRQESTSAATPVAGSLHGAWRPPGGGHAIVDAKTRDAPAGPRGTDGGSYADSAAARGAAVQPPQPLPSRGPDALPPALDPTYRSTVEIPPPPLLDVHAPPPLAVGWAAHDAVRPPLSPDPPAQAAAPNSYVVRDGDDLTGIAMKVYGHAGAAEAIWNANRDRLADPRLLPIGMPLRMPPSWMLPAARAAAGAGVIEPRPTREVAAETPSGIAGTASSARSEGHWLGDFSASGFPVATSASKPSVPAGDELAGRRLQAGIRPGTVRVAPGDSLDVIAVRVYGDRGMAGQIWAANRDRLRSPELLVPGIELRLP